MINNISNKYFTGLNSIRTLAHMINIAYVAKTSAWMFVVDDERKIDYTTNVLSPILFALGMEHGFALSKHLYGKQFINKIAPLFKEDIQRGLLDMKDFKEFSRLLGNEYFNNVTGDKSIKNIINEAKKSFEDRNKYIASKLVELNEKGIFRFDSLRKFHKNWNALGALVGAFLAVFWAAYSTSKFDAKILQPWEDKYVKNGGNYQKVVYPIFTATAITGLCLQGIKRMTTNLINTNPGKAFALRWIGALAIGIPSLYMMLREPLAIARGEKKGPLYDKYNKS